MKLSPEQLRTLENLALAYDTWMQAVRAAPAPNRWLMWKSRQGRDYLYEARNRRGDSRSLGPRAPETEALHAQYTQEREQRERARAVLGGMADTIRIYRSLRLPLIDGMAGKILRAADERRLLGAALLVVGTNTMAAYEIEAGERFATGYDSTNDLDMTWSAPAPLELTSAKEAPIMDALKEVDESFTLNYEKPFQARNAAAYEVEVLMAPSVAAHYPPAEPMRPVPLPEQEWLLRGQPISHVVLDRGAMPVRLVVPDPRWMALHKLWLSDKPERNRKKVDKDRIQGTLLLEVIQRAMPHYPINDEFIREVPDELRQYLP